MKVTLLAYTKDAERLVASAGRTCYSSDSPIEIYAGATSGWAKDMLRKIHDSVLEHAVFSFSIEGISRACSHQLVRHRMASYSQQSQRYVKTKDIDYVIPESIDGAIEYETFCTDSDDRVLVDCLEEYDTILSKLIGILEGMGIPNEDIRYFYPQGIKTNIVVTMNARELMHFFSLRCCNRAQWEIRELANLMLKECKGVYPDLFRNAGADCIRTGRCPEHKPCGSMKVKQRAEDGKGNWMRISTRKNATSSYL